MNEGMYVRIEGLTSIETALSSLEPKQMKSTLMHASARGASIVRAAMKAELDGRGTGKLRGSVRYKVMRRSTTKLVGHVVAPMGKLASARALVEYGHDLWLGGKKKDGQGHSVGTVPAHPFIRPAWAKSQAAALKAMEDYLFAQMKEF